MTEVHTTREGWLAAATEELRPLFSEHGATIPATIRFAMAFSSFGARGNRIGECWNGAASADGFHTIIIRADRADVGYILGILTHELVHACLPIGSGHGVKFRKLATAVGLEGKVASALPGAKLAAYLESEIAARPGLGAIPHGRLNFSESEGAPKKQGTRMLKVTCADPACGYMVRMTKKWAEIALPDCPVSAEHGRMVCEALDDDGEGEGG